MNNGTERYKSILKTVTLAIFTAIAYVSVCVLRIKVSFLTFDIKDAIITVAAMIFGPASAVAMAFAVALLELLTLSDTMLYGFIMNVLSTLALSVTASLIYKYKRNMAGAVIGLLSGVFAVTAVMMLANLFITPYYMGVERSDVVRLLPMLLLPFNLTKAVMNAAVTLLIYKPTVSAVRRAGIIKGSDKGYKPNKTAVLVTVIAAAVITLSLLVFFKVLGAEVKWF